jgi:hypothetical protein
VSDAQARPGPARPAVRSGQIIGAPEPEGATRGMSEHSPGPAPASHLERTVAIGSWSLWRSGTCGAQDNISAKISS